MSGITNKTINHCNFSINFTYNIVQTLNIKNMKSIKLIAIFAVLLLSGCNGNSENEETIAENPEYRIKFKDSRHIDGIYYAIIEVDSVEYLTTFSGGIIRITK